ncbi:MAG TPA: DUF4956 domain-containing protein [Ruania sp.]|nr:DUF4956 domain-containing protein [Ruania sp.]
MWNIALPLLADVVAITLVVAAYFRRHQRRDLVLAYVALNIGVLAVTMMLSSAPVGAGLGLGLFGILSIIRLRSDSITQEEIAYYFVALALGLLAGLHPGPLWVTPALSALLVVAMLTVDHPRVLPRARRQLLTLDRAVPAESELRALIEQRLDVDVKHLIVEEVDFVRDVTVVDVRFRRRPEQEATAATPAAATDQWQQWPAGAAAGQPAPSWPSPARPMADRVGPAVSNPTAPAVDPSNSYAGGRR